MNVRTDRHTDGRMDAQPDYLMSPAPVTGGGTKVLQNSSTLVQAHTYIVMCDHTLTLNPSSDVHKRDLKCNIQKTVITLKRGQILQSKCDCLR